MIQVVHGLIEFFGVRVFLSLIFGNHRRDFSILGYLYSFELGECLIVILIVVRVLILLFLESSLVVLSLIITSVTSTFLSCSFLLILLSAFLVILVSVHASGSTTASTTSSSWSFLSACLCWGIGSRFNFFRICFSLLFVDSFRLHTN